MHSDDIHKAVFLFSRFKIITYIIIPRPRAAKQNAKQYTYFYYSILTHFYLYVNIFFHIRQLIIFLSDINA